MVRVSFVRIAYGTHGTYRQRPFLPTHPQLLLLPRRVGTYLVAVTLNDEPILGSRFALRVHEDAADPASCVAAGAGLRRVVAGELGRFTVQAWDAYGNIVRRRTSQPGPGGAASPACLWGVTTHPSPHALPLSV